ncbi:MAG: sulfite exporter TauE/SafE family protein [Bacteroidia bacterium]|nr:sulfite exporter TauE/SafE family protein [Bacteroidia bacterium]
MPLSELILFTVLLSAVAFLYASVGHGGASGYLALMALFGFSTVVMRSSSLVLNVLVSFIAFLQFYRAGYFRWRLLLWFALPAVPAAFLGAMVDVDDQLYKRILGIILLFPVLRLLGLFGKESEEQRKVIVPVALILGAGIGFLSGMIGIGGGIILSPVILFLRWGNLKEAAAASALFIFLNSLSGLGGMMVKGFDPDPYLWIWVGAGVLGGTAGAWFGSSVVNKKILKGSLALVLTVACYKLLTI